MFEEKTSQEEDLALSYCFFLIRRKVLGDTFGLRKYRTLIR